MALRSKAKVPFLIAPPITLVIIYHQDHPANEGGSRLEAGLRYMLFFSPALMAKEPKVTEYTHLLKTVRLFSAVGEGV